MLNYDSLELEYEPFPIGIAHPAMDEADYLELVESFPPVELMRYKPDKGGKYSLSQVNHPKAYRKFVRETPAWRRFHDYVKSPGYIEGALEMLRRHHIDLGFPMPPFWEQVYLKVRALKRGNPVPHFPSLKARFEFSAMPVTGGNILPHTDHQKKVITMVITMLKEGEWDDAWGGGTSMVWPKDRSRAFNRVNDYLDFDEVDCIKTFPFRPNQCLVFIKTDFSWHAVWPMTGNDPTKLRRTLTINIESS
jgi:hypothetical protein